jgi:C_GCAxxG_C_C family probable redox protein
MSKAEEAREMFTQANCAQAVFAAFAAGRGVDRGTAFRIACGFGAGMGRSGSICGAVNGAIMALSVTAEYGQTPEDGARAKDEVYALVREFMRRFTARHGTLICRELLGCDLGTPAGAAKAKEENLFKTRCPAFVESAAGIVEELLAEKRP